MRSKKLARRCFITLPRAEIERAAWKFDHLNDYHSFARGDFRFQFIWPEMHN